MKKKILSMFLALVLIFSVSLPLYALEYNEVEAESYMVGCAIEYIAYLVNEHGAKLRIPCQESNPVFNIREHIHIDTEGSFAQLYQFELLLPGCCGNKGFEGIVPIVPFGWCSCGGNYTTGLDGVWCIITTLIRAYSNGTFLGWQGFCGGREWIHYRRCNRCGTRFWSEIGPGHNRWYWL